PGRCKRGARGMRDRPLRIDCLAREIPGRAALVASGTDGAEAAVQLCKDLTEVLSSGEYRLRMVTEDEARPMPPEHVGLLEYDNGVNANAVDRSAFIGFPMTSMKASSCAVCRRPIKVGDSIYYSREVRSAAHKQCGRSSL